MRRGPTLAVGGWAGHLVWLLRAGRARPGRVRRRSAPAGAGVSSSVPVLLRLRGRSGWLHSLVHGHRSVVHSITSRRPGFGVCHLGWDDPLEPPAALRAPRWYFAGTPAAHRAQGARFAVLARGDDPPGTPRCASRPAMVLRRHTGRSPGPRGPVRCAGPGGRPPWNPPVRFAPRDGTSPAHRPLTGPKGPGSLAGMSASP